MITKITGVSPTIPADNRKWDRRHQSQASSGGKKKPGKPYDPKASNGFPVSKVFFDA